MEGPPLLGRTPQLSGSFFHRGTPLEPCPELSLKMFTMKKPAHLCLQLGNSSVHVPRKMSTKTNQWPKCSLCTILHNSSVGQDYYVNVKSEPSNTKKNSPILSDLLFKSDLLEKEEYKRKGTRLYWERPSPHPVPLWIPPLPPTKMLSIILAILGF